MNIVKITEKELENAGYEMQIQLDSFKAATFVEENYSSRMSVCCGRKMYVMGSSFCLRAPAREELKIMSENIEEFIQGLEFSEEV